MPSADVALASQVKSRFTLKQRLSLRLISWAAYLLIRFIGPTLRYEIIVEEGGPIEIEHAVYAFWHRGIIPICYFFRNRKVAVMTSASFDGEYIARVIQKFGYTAVRGSSSRDAISALLEMHHVMQSGDSIGFTIDGPRGPRYVAKPGPTLVAKNTQLPIICFHAAVKHGLQLNSWDRLVIPFPFSRVCISVGSLIRVSADADKHALQASHTEMQETLDRVRIRAEKYLGLPSEPPRSA